MMMLLLRQQGISRARPHRSSRPLRHLFYIALIAVGNDFSIHYDFQLTSVSAGMLPEHQMRRRGVDVLENHVQLVDNSPDDVEQEYQGKRDYVEISLVHRRHVGGCCFATRRAMVMVMVMMMATVTDAGDCLVAVLGLGYAELFGRSAALT